MTEPDPDPSGTNGSMQQQEGPPREGVTQHDDEHGKDLAVHQSNILSMATAPQAGGAWEDFWMFLTAVVMWFVAFAVVGSLLRAKTIEPHSDVWAAAFGGMVATNLGLFTAATKVFSFRAMGFSPAAKALAIVWLLAFVVSIFASMVAAIAVVTAGGDTTAAVAGLFAIAFLPSGLTLVIVAAVLGRL